MIAHTTLAVTDCQRATAFYLEALAPLGYQKKMDFGEAVGFNDGKNTDFWLAKHDSVTPLHLAFEAKNREEVKAFYEAALAAGGEDNGEPGIALNTGRGITPPLSMILTGIMSRQFGTTTRRRMAAVAMRKMRSRQR